MIIRQAHISKPMIKFKFNVFFHLTPYREEDEALVVFGCYREQDIDVIRKHSAPVVLVWGGRDSHKVDLQIFHELEHVTHVAGVPAICDWLEQSGITCHLMRMPARQRINAEGNLGTNVYAYVQKGKPWYHGEDIINQLEIDQRLLIANHSVDRNRWLAGEDEKHYSQAFIGLFLSQYAGGASSIVEMGIRGIRVVTNVLQLPHCISWEDKEHIEESIREEAENVGAPRNRELAEDVYSELMRPMNGFRLDEVLYDP